MQIVHTGTNDIFAGTSTTIQCVFTQSMYGSSCGVHNFEERCSKRKLQCGFTLTSIHMYAATCSKIKNVQLQAYMYSVDEHAGQRKKSVNVGRPTCTMYQ